MQATKEARTRIIDEGVNATPPPAASEGEETLAEYASMQALRAALPVGIITGLLVLLLNLSRQQVPFIDDPRGFGTIFFLVSLAVALIGGGFAYVMGTRYQNERILEQYRRSWVVGVLPLAVAYVAVTALGVGVVLEVTGEAFKELELARLQGVFLAGLAATAVTNWIISDAMQITLRRILTLIVITVGAGLYYSMAQNDNPYWWRVSFSYLGTHDSNVDARQQFNVALVFAGFMLLVMQQFLMKDIRILFSHDAISRRSFRFFQVSLILLGFLTAMIGLFPSRVSPLYSIIHNLSAYSLAAILILYMAGIRWLIPIFPREFYSASLIATIAMVGTLILAAFGYFNTVGLEIIAFVIGGMWLGLFTKEIGLKASGLEPAAYLQ